MTKILLRMQIVKLLENKCYKILRTTFIGTRKALGLTFHGSWYCQMLRINSSRFSVQVNSGYSLTLNYVLTKKR